ncbi:MAG TPA: hypothetical protein VHD91_04325 [Gaiellaceae bacterium]|nr:hypothetical protein [Gaiellaceae bacterium]
MKTFLAVTVAALALAAPALAAYPGTYGMQNAQGVAAPDGKLTFRAAKSAEGTRLVAVRPGTGTVVRGATIPGQFGIPTMITTHGKTLGMFRDGHAFVLQSVGIEPTSSFRIVSTRTLAVLDRIALKGSWEFDALSPDGSTLYLIQHATLDDFQHYVVRAFDLRTHTLLPGRIADKTQKSWTMEGYPDTRVVTASGRWVYTLYTNPGGFPFVHALDTVAGVAHCVGFAWTGDQGPLSRFSLRLAGDRLLLLRPGGKVYRAIDRTTWAVSLR